jgi:hypothetical protein
MPLASEMTTVHKIIAGLRECLGMQAPSARTSTSQARTKTQNNVQDVMLPTPQEEPT